MNLLDGVLIREGEITFAQIGDVKMPVDASANHQTGTKIVLGVRPEHLSVAPENSENAALPMNVDIVEPTGAESHVYGRFGGKQIIAAFSGRSPLGTGDVIKLTAPPQFLHLFERETGNRIN
jgi:multiple sugar transport system ATP-binding protein